MKDFDLTYRQFGTAILIEWPQIVDDVVLQDILAFEKIILESDLPDMAETVPAFASLTVFFDHLKEVDKVISTLKEIYPQRTNREVANKTWNIPVCYGQEFGEDIHLVANRNGISHQQVIDGHCQGVYKVHFIGFLPGFLYLGGLPGHLHCPRKQNPELSTKKGSVGIGGAQTGIYPIDSPGGWNIIGNTPISLFNAQQDTPCFVKPGDRIKFHPITPAEHKQISSDIKSGQYNVTVE